MTNLCAKKSVKLKGENKGTNTKDTFYAILK